MRFSRFQIALLGATPGLAALALSRGMTGECGRRCARSWPISTEL
jgi:hypothetical protein